MMNFFGRRLSLDTTRAAVTEDSPVSTPVGTPTSPGMWKGNPQMSSSQPINIPQANNRRTSMEEDRTPSLLQSASATLLTRAQSAPNPRFEPSPASYDERADPESNVIGERLLWWLLFPPGNF